MSQSWVWRRRRVPVLLACALTVGCGGLYRVPAPERVARAEPSSEVPVEDDGGTPREVVHLVERGETLWRIARRYAVAPAAIAEANSLADPNRLEIGQVLLIPAGVVTASESPSRERGVAGSPEPIGGTILLWPVPGGAVLSRFGDPRLARTHAGLDIDGLAGQDVLAAGDGVVVYSGERRGGYGKTVLLDHGNALRTLYAHGSELLVGKGDQVRQGQPIARLGRSGNATTDHCHFEVRRSDTPVDPIPYFVQGADRAARR